MTPEQKIKRDILLLAAKQETISLTEPITPENVDELYEANDEDGQLQDWRYEIREGQVETKLPCPSSRHYESKSVARKMSDGSWVGWTFWYGGGKHGEPEAIDWMDEAYDLNVQEEEKTVIVQTFSLKE